MKLLYKSFINVVDNESLISGLLSAFHQFTMVEFHQPIESIEMAGFRWIYIVDEEYDLLLIASASKDLPSDLLRGRLNTIREAFIADFGQRWLERGENWSVETTPFEPFLDTLEQFYLQWEEAEIMISLA